MTDSNSQNPNDTLPPPNPSQFAPPAEDYAPTQQFEYAPTQREIDFAQIVAATDDPVEALTLSGFVSRREADETARSKLWSFASRLLASPAVTERIDYYKLLHRKSMMITVDRLTQELAATAFTDPADFTNEDGALHSNVRDVPRYARAAIKEIKEDANGRMTYKMHDKLKAIQLLGDLGGHFDESNRAKAPQVNISIGDVGRTATTPQTIDVTPTPAPTEDCLR